MKRKLKFGKVGRPKKYFEPEFPPDPLADNPKPDWLDITGTCCDGCLNIREGLDLKPECCVLSELQLMDCSSRCTTIDERLEQLKSILNYAMARKDSITVKEVSVELNQVMIAKNSERNGSYFGWQQAYYLSLKRGKGGGGGEKEKNPNKSRPKKPLHNGLSFVEPWEGF